MAGSLAEEGQIGPRMTVIRRALAAIVLMLASPAAPNAQTNLQLWGNLTLDWVKSERLAYELDFEPKLLLSGPEDEPSWRNLDVTPTVEYSPKRWLDLVAETAVGFTRQTDDVNSIEITPRLGARVHLFSRALQHHPRERAPTRRIVVRDLVRVESRNFFYRGDKASSLTMRFRNRLEFLVPLNKERLTEDGARYLLADWEWFVPIDNDQEERFANKQRIRTGFGYRHSFAWRFEALYMWTRSRNTIEDCFTTSDNIIDVRVKRVF